MSLDHTAAEALARKILHHSRRRISHICPILLEAIYALPEKVRPLSGPLSTDAAALWFDPDTVVEDFRKDRDAVTRQLLHVTAHCLLGHPQLRSGFPQPKAFDCGADLKAAQLAQALCGLHLAVKAGSCEQSVQLETLPHLRTLTDLVQRPDHEGMLCRQKAKTVRFDEHSLWSGSPLDADGGEIRPAKSADPSAIGTENRTDAADIPDWSRIRQSMLDGICGTLPGSCAGMLRENFSVADRGLPYADFLKRFAASGEQMLTDPDSFDVRWYYWGLEHYGDIPLLEPTELSELPRPDDFVIALDTSGSCSGEVCKRFLKETLGILQDIAAGTPRFRVWLLQCDTRIRQEMLLESSDQAEELFRNFTAHGFGGTDFRPVFKRVEALRQSGQLPRVRGLLYLTDGWGDYPDTPTDYPTVFLIPDEDQDYLPSGTEWITRLYLHETDFTLKEATAT